MSFRQTLTTLICENKTALLELQLTDETDTELDLGQLSSVTVTLYVASRGTTFGQILNSRDAQSILNENGGTVSASGLLQLLLSIADNVLTLQARGFETHVALIEWAWAGGTRAGAKELTYTIANQAKIT